MKQDPALPQRLQRYGRFVCVVYVRSWYTCSSPAGAPPFNDIALQTRLREYDDSELSQAGLKMMRRHSWYVSPELATMVLFSDKINDDAAKAEMVANITDERGPHLSLSLQRLS